MFALLLLSADIRSGRPIVCRSKMQLVYCLILIVDIRASPICHSKAPLAGNGGALVKSGNAAVADGRGSLTGRPQNGHLRCCVRLKEPHYSCANTPSIWPFCGLLISTISMRQYTGIVVEKLSIY